MVRLEFQVKDPAGLLPEAAGKTGKRGDSVYQQGGDKERRKKR